MIYRFIMLSDEVDDFRREYRLDADASFLDLHDVIVDSVGFEKGGISSFFLCDSDWARNTEITLLEMDTSSEVDSIIMENTRLSDYLEDEKQKLMFVYDYLSERAFYMELREIIFGESLDKAECTKSIGKAPVQILKIEEEPVVIPKVVIGEPTALDEDFYGNDEYNADELDADGFDEVDDDDVNDISIEDLDI